MKAALIGGNSKSSQWTVEAMKKYFDEVDHLYIKYIDINFTGKQAEVHYKGKILPHYDCMYIKGSYRYAQLLRSLADLYHSRKDIYLPYTPSAYTIAHDKLLTQLMLEKKSIPMPRTYLTATIDAARQVLANMNYPVIMKFPQGTQGKGVMFADSYASASSILDALHALKQPFIIQEYIDTGSTDSRLFVIGDKVVAAYKRISNGKEVRANIHAGGVGESYTPDEYTKKIAIEVARCVGADICGVDILEGPTGPLVIEANLSPGLQGVTKYTKINVADKIAKFLFAKTDELVQANKDREASIILSSIDKTTEEQVQEVISTLDFRNNRILLPQVVTAWTGFGERDDIQIKARKGIVTLKRFM